MTVANPSRTTHTRLFISKDDVAGQPDALADSDEVRDLRQQLQEEKGEALYYTLMTIFWLTVIQKKIGS
jgi:hypothetical protein